MIIFLIFILVIFYYAVYLGCQTAEEAAETEPQAAEGAQTAEKGRKTPEKEKRKFKQFFTSQ